jgi:hypothetical protein
MKKYKNRDRKMGTPSIFPFFRESAASPILENRKLGNMLCVPNFGMLK